jgi:hypothetical protein
MLLSREQLRRTRPQFVPRLSLLGNAQRKVLELCDGRTALVEIEQEVCRCYPSLFRARSEATAFIADVVAHAAE